MPSLLLQSSGVLLFESILILEEVKLPLWFFPYQTSFDIITVTKRMFPAFMNGCRCITSSFHVDRKDKIVADLSRAVSAVKQSTIKLTEVIQSVLDNSFLTKKENQGNQDSEEGIVASAILQMKKKEMNSSSAGQISMSRSIELISDPKKLRNHDKAQDRYEFFKMIIAYLVVWYIAKNILLMGQTSSTTRT